VPNTPRAIKGWRADSPSLTGRNRHAAPFPPRRVHATAKVHLEKSGDGFAIPRIELVTEAEVPNIDETKFREQAETAKRNCPVSKLLTGAEIALDAKLVGH
jgi:osmotically inducible protein OsmC